MNDLTTPERAVTALNRIRVALTQAADVSEVLAFRDQADTIHHYIKHAALSLEMQNQAAEVKLLVERKIGSLLADMTLRGGDHKSKLRSAKNGLENLGISRNQSARWQLEASLPDAEFFQYVKETNNEGLELTSRGLMQLARLRVRAVEAARDHRNPFDRLAAGLLNFARKQQRFPCIYADPPWTFGKSKTEKAGLPKKLCKLPVKLVVAENAHLHLWVPPESLEHGLAVLRAWGFRYKTTLVRGKLPQGYGDYWQQAHDLLLLGVRGRLPFRDSTLSSWLDGRESLVNGSMREVCALISRASPGPWLDLFATTSSTGWTSTLETHARR